MTTSANENTMLDTVIEASSMVSIISTFSESTCSYKDDEREGPPLVIIVPNSPNDQALVSSSSAPYAQLCYDPHEETLVTIIETRRKGRRNVLSSPFPSLQRAYTAVTTSSSSSSQLSNASTFTLSTTSEQRAQRKERHAPFILGTEMYHVDENRIYLLADEQHDDTRKTTVPSCARAFTKIRKVHRRPFRFLQVRKHQYQPRTNRPPLKERIVKHGYEPVQSQRSIQKWV